MKISSKNSNVIFKNLQNDISSGLLYTHTRINDNTKKTLESTSFLYALIELLNENGVISIEELDERKKQVAGRLVKKFTESGIGLMCQEPEYDKYNFKDEACIDCVNRLDVCEATCCKLPFALSKQDVEERIVRWEFGKPYLIAHDSDGYCVHVDRETYKCTVHEHRPVPCRGFDCKDNEKWKIWEDYDKKVINPKLSEQIKETNGKI
ncbi:MAG: YkgJ family cysteine cluster protein [Deltaproteobacteria bacterium]|nr:YkgJ family cysteine cluster protein [Deltaproteobacteria bacterium]